MKEILGKINDILNINHEYSGINYLRELAKNISIFWM